MVPCWRIIWKTQKKTAGKANQMNTQARHCEADASLVSAPGLRKGQLNVRIGNEGEYPPSAPGARPIRRSQRAATPTTAGRGTGLLAPKGLGKSTGIRDPSKRQRPTKKQKRPQGDNQQPSNKPKATQPNQPKAKQPARQQILAHLREWSHRLREDCNSGPSKLSAEVGGHKTAVFVTPKTWPKELQKRSYRLQLVGGCQKLQQG